jgi:hypothetical protein
MLALLQEKRRLKSLEDDMQNEIQSLLQTIDDHSRVNQRVNKHYQKRLAEIERDLVHMQWLITSSTGVNPMQ